MRVVRHHHSSAQHARVLDGLGVRRDYYAVAVDCAVAELRAVLSGGRHHDPVPDLVEAGLSNLVSSVERCRRLETGPGPDLSALFD